MSAHHSSQDARLNTAKLSRIAYQEPGKVDSMWHARSQEPAADDNWSPMAEVSEPPQYVTLS